MQFLPGIFMKEMEKPLSEIGISASNFAQDQICYAQQIGAPAWGWSATALPPGFEYCGWGCVRDDILVPHASILAADCINSAELVTNLLALEGLGARPPVCDGPQTFDYGFISYIDWQTGEVSAVYLLLDQSMAFLSLVNHSTNGRIRDILYQDKIAQKATTLIPECSGVSLSHSYSQSDKPGTVVSYTHILVNTGNHTDTIFLDVTSSLSWPVTATIMPPVQRDAGMTATVVMSLTIPVSATICTVENTTITATSKTDVTVFDTATDITTVGTCIFLPLVLKNS